MIKLVAIGDSMSQGFQNGSISKTYLSFPALIAKAQQLDPLDFRVPYFEGRGGLPVNVELMLHRLARWYGKRINPLEAVPAAFTVREFLDEVEDYWECGAGSRSSDTGPLHHNLAVWGFEVEDADTLTEAVCRKAIPTPDDNIVKQVPEMAMYRTARRTLNPGNHQSLEQLSQVDAARLLASESGGIENLIFWLGANNALGTVTDLEIRWSEDADLHRYAHERSSNLWLPEHFERAYRRVADRIDEIGARFVFVGNVPHVTIPPVSRGVSVGRPERDEDGYYEYYTRFWVWDEDFRKDPEKYSRLTRADARRIDATIDEFNRIIAGEARKRRWHLIDLCKILDSLAFRRRAGQVRYKFPSGLVRALEKNRHLNYLVDSENGKSVQLDTRYLRLDPKRGGRIAAGGLVSLDGVHSTTIGYGVLAHEFLRTMNRAWRNHGVEAVQTDLGWWEHVVAADSLVANPPKNLNHLRELLGFLAGRSFIGDLTHTLGGRFLR